MAKRVHWMVYSHGVDEMMRDPRVGSMLEGVAKEVIDHARSNAPVLSGRYRDSFVVAPARIVEGHMAVICGSTDYKWHWMEYGTVKMHPFRTLGNAVAAVAGLEAQLL